MREFVLRQVTRHLAYRVFDRNDGPDRLSLLRALEASQWAPAETIGAGQAARLSNTLEHAARTVPFYEPSLRAAGWRGPGSDAFAVLGRMPVLTKSDIREHAAALRSVAVPDGDTRVARTGGSTGVSLAVTFDKTCEAHRIAAAWRSDQWAGWRPGGSKAAVWGNPPVATTWRQAARAWLYDRTFYLDTMHLTPATMRAFYDEYQRRRPDTVFGHSHSIYILASFLESQRLAPHPPRGIVSTSMMLLAPERAVIERVFGCPVTNRYGCEEVGLIACECDRHQGLHVNADHVLVELLDEDDRPVESRQEGRVVLTDLLNRAMPFIRYEVGDVATWSDRTCECGRALPLLEKIVGRTADFLVRPDGGLVAGVSLIERTLTAMPGLQQMQFEQNARDCVLVRIVPSAHYTQATLDGLRDELQAAFGPGMSLDVQRVDELDQAGNGKYRFSICNVSRP